MQEPAYFDLSFEDTPESLKVPPHSLESEQSVLGGLLRDNKAWMLVAELLNEVDFYRPEHRVIFNFIKMLCEEGQACDIVTLAERLERHGKLNTIGGHAYLGILARNTPDVSNIATYAHLVRERSILRQLIQVGSEVANSVFDMRGRSVRELLDNAEKLVFSIAEQEFRNRGGFVEIKDILVKTLDQIDHLYHSGESITGISTGFKRFDEVTSGLQRSDLIIIAGRPSMGKSSFALNIAEQIITRPDNPHPVAIFSMEMPNEQLIMRLLSSLSSINLQNIRTGRLADDDWSRLTSAIASLEKAPLFIDDTPALTPTELRARTRRLAQERGQLGLVIIDYLQLMQIPDSRENRAIEVSEISRSLKALAKELNVPVVALSQLNRGLEQRPDKRPRMADLRESGSLEQDADLIVFIYRDEVYNKDTPDKGIAEIIIAKQRNGPTETLNLTFLGQFTKFVNLDTSEYYTGSHAPSKYSY